MKINTSFPAYMPDVSNSIKEGYVPVTTKNSLTIKLFPEDINGLSGFGLNVDVNFFEWQELSIISRKSFLYSNIKSNILSALEFGHCFFYDFDNEDFDIECSNLDNISFDEIFEKWRSGIEKELQDLSKYRDYIISPKQYKYMSYKDNIIRFKDDECEIFINKSNLFPVIEEHFAKYYNNTLTHLQKNAEKYHEKNLEAHYIFFANDFQTSLYELLHSKNPTKEDVIGFIEYVCNFFDINVNKD